MILIFLNIPLYDPVLFKCKFVMVVETVHHFKDISVYTCNPTLYYSVVPFGTEKNAEQPKLKPSAK